MSARSIAALRAALLLAAAAAVCGCTQRYPLKLALQSFQVRLAVTTPAQPTGAPNDPLEFISGATCDGLESPCENGEQCEGGRCSRCWTVDIVALGTDGEPFDYSGPVHLDVSPGFVTDTTRYAEVQGGEAKGVRICINRTTGPTNVWVEQDGYKARPADVRYGQCNDGIDNDDNGMVDLADPGCLDATDDVEAPVTFATGVAETLYFDNPTIRQAERGDSIASSPMAGQQVRIDRGAMLVTNVVANGFYVTDMDDAAEERPFNSIFVFTFSAPEDVYLGDLACWIAGGVQEHVGQTQLVFPSFEVWDPSREDKPEGDCARVAPYLDLKVDPAAGGADLTERLVVEDQKDKVNYQKNVYQNSLLLESYESSFIRLSQVQVTNRLIACDRDQNGNIEDGEENECRDECRKDPLCTDLEGFFEFRQWAALAGGKKKMGASVSLAARFTPLALDYLGQPDKNHMCDVHHTPLGFLEYTCPDRVLHSISGSLRHIYLCGTSSKESSCDLQFWILDPRSDADVVLPKDLDQDEDGVTPEAGDCDDNDPQVHPGGTEVPGNARDDDCDGVAS